MGFLIAELFYMDHPNQKLTDPERLAALWTQSQPAVSAYLATVLPDYHSRQEVLQNTAVVLVRKFADYDPDRPFTAWAIGVARFELLKHRSKRAGGPVVFSDALLSAAADRFAEVDVDQGPAEEALEICLGQLTDRSRKLLKLRYTADLPTEQIAKQVGAKHSAVRVALHRVRKTLRDCIDQRLGRVAGAQGVRP